MGIKKKEMRQKPEIPKKFIKKIIELGHLLRIKKEV